MLRARDMALAEQRARHVKESVVIREQRYTLATKEPGFAGKIAQLFGWADAGGSSRSNSPLFVSPVRSRSVSPIGSPSNTRRREGSNWLDGGGPLATHPESGVADVVVGRTELSKRLDLLESPTVKVSGDEAGKGSSKESLTLPTNISGTPGPAVSLITDSAGKEGRAPVACPRCTQLHQELETALTDRTLAEAELVSMRKSISQVDAASEWESSGGAGIRHGTERARSSAIQAESDGGAAGETAPLPPSGITDSDLGLRDELGRLEDRLASLGEDGIAPSNVDEKVMDGQSLPKLQVCHQFLTTCCSLPESARVAGR